MLVGFGYDVHQFVEHRPLVLGGVNVDHHKGLQGHSDADVVIHALMDAVLGAAGLGDIGQHFPDTDPAYAGIASTRLLHQVMGLINDQGYRVNNVDITIAAQSPKLAPYRPQMREVLSEALRMPLERVNIKATTTEYLGFVGREEGIAAYAMVSLEAHRVNEN